MHRRQGLASSQRPLEQNFCSFEAAVFHVVLPKNAEGFRGQLSANRFFQIQLCASSPPLVPAQRTKVVACAQGTFLASQQKMPFRRSGVALSLVHDGPVLRCKGAIGGQRVLI